MKCTDCGEEGHKAGWPYCPGKIMRKTEPKYVPVVVHKIPGVVHVDKPVVHTPVDVVHRKDRHKNTEERKAYRKEWTRKKRARES